MKKILMWLTVLALMLTGAAFADQENAPVMLVKLPEDAQMVENVAFDDGDFVQTYQLNGGAYVQLLRYAGENGVSSYGVLMYVSMIFHACLPPRSPRGRASACPPWQTGTEMRTAAHRPGSRSG